MQAKAWEDDQKRSKGIKAKKIKNKPKVARSGKGTTKSDSSKSKIIQHRLKYIFFSK